MKAHFLAGLLFVAAAVPDSAEMTQPLAVGAKLPSVSLPNVDGKTIALDSAYADQSIVLVFYRGGW